MSLKTSWWIRTMNADKRMAKGSWSVGYHTKLIRSLESDPLKVHRQLPNVSCPTTFLVRTTRVAYLVTVRHQTPTVSFWLSYHVVWVNSFSWLQLKDRTVVSSRCYFSHDYIFQSKNSTLTSQNMNKREVRCQTDETVADKLTAAQHTSLIRF